MADWVSARGAAEILAGDGFSRAMSRRLLATGLAGDPVRTSSATLYDAARVRDLLDRPSVDVDRLPSPCDRVMLESRVAADSTADDWARIGNAGAVVRVHLQLLVERHGLVPAVHTCCGFVLGGSDVVGALGLPDNHAYLQVRPPGAWFESFAGRRLHSTAGNPWRLWVQPAAA